MNKLTAEECRELIQRLNDKQAHPMKGLTGDEKLYLQALEIALPILEQQERGEGEWIECSEQIPQPLDWVIAHDEVGTVKAYICQQTGEWIRDNGDELYRVTHWQPLPSPPGDL
ncbi:DUF551 domain-containing protein [Pantoea anthophila]|uniref:DUF551 domain-containing protein n=1 Tax=Pantoea anthophila TaxID=470931 RepID=UPI003CE6B6E1